MKQYLIALFIVVGFMSAGNFLLNGDFEQPLNTGWMQVTSGSYITIDRNTSYEPDPDYEVYASKGAGNGYAKLYQVVDIPTSLNLFNFSIKAKLYAYDNNADTLCWAAASVIVSYLNSSGSCLGETRICMWTAPCPWQNTSTIHLINVSDSLWHNYGFNIATELTNLPGVNPASVKKIAVSLYDTTAHTC